MEHTRTWNASAVGKLLGVVVLGLALGAAIGIGLAGLTNRGRLAHSTGGRPAQTPEGGEAPRPPVATAPASSDPLRAIAVRGAERGPFRVLSLGDDMLSAYRPAVTKAL